MSGMVNPADQRGIDAIGPMPGAAPKEKGVKPLDARVAGQGVANIANKPQKVRPDTLADKKIGKGVPPSESQKNELKELDKMLRDMGANIPEEKELEDEKKAQALFRNIVKNPILKEKFRNHEYLKLRRGMTGLDHSYVIQKLNKRDPSSTDARIFKVIHEEAGKVGEGGMKIAKAWVATDSRETFVRGKFKNFDLTELRKEYPEMEKVLASLKNNPVPNTAPGQLIFLASKQLDSLGNISTKVAVNILTPFAESDLLKKIESGDLDDSQKMSLAKDILRGVSGLHARGIFHRDLKPANINLIEGQGLIADFDFAVLRATPGPQAGTPAYMAPEVLRGEVQNNRDLARGDAYALGVTLYELFNAVSPITAGMLPDRLEEIANIDPEDFKAVWESQHGVPDPDNSVNGVIYMLMNPDPAKRMSVDEALARLEKIKT